MNILEMTKILPSIVRRNDILDDISSIKKRVTECSIPTYSSVLSLKGLSSPTSRPVKDIFTRFTRRVKKSKGDLVGHTLYCLENIEKITNRLEQLTRVDVNTDIVVDGITYKKLYYLQLVLYLDFYIRYSSSLADFIISCELSDADKSSLIRDFITPYDERYIYDGFEIFLVLSGVFSIQADDVKVLVSKIPNNLISKEFQDEYELTGSVDPLRLGIIPLISSFKSFFLRRALDKAYKEHYAYEKLKQERYLISKKIEHLNMLNQNLNNQALVKEIESSQNRLNVIKAKIKKEEDRVMNHDNWYHETLASTNHKTSSTNKDIEETYARLGQSGSNNDNEW